MLMLAQKPTLRTTAFQNQREAGAEMQEYKTTRPAQWRESNLTQLDQRVVMENGKRGGGTRRQELIPE